MNFPSPDEDTKEFFKSVLPLDSRIVIRPMFGNVASFVNGNMFAGTFGKELMVRLAEEDRRKLVETKVTSLFEPMKGRPMKEYILVPRAWMKQEDIVRRWMSKSFTWAAMLPPKKKP